MVKTASDVTLNYWHFIKMLNIVFEKTWAALDFCKAGRLEITLTGNICCSSRVSNYTEKSIVTSVSGQTLS